MKTRKKINRISLSSTRQLSKLSELPRFKWIVVPEGTIAAAIVRLSQIAHEATAWKVGCRFIVHIQTVSQCTDA